MQQLRVQNWLPEPLTVAMFGFSPTTNSMSVMANSVLPGLPATATTPSGVLIQVPSSALAAATAMPNNTNPFLTLTYQRYVFVNGEPFSNYPSGYTLFVPANPDVGDHHPLVAGQVTPALTTFGNPAGTANMPVTLNVVPFVPGQTVNVAIMNNTPFPLLVGSIVSSVTVPVGGTSAVMPAPNQGVLITAQTEDPSNTAVPVTLPVASFVGTALAFAPFNVPVAEAVSVTGTSIANGYFAVTNVAWPFQNLVTLVVDFFGDTSGTVLTLSNNTAAAVTVSVPIGSTLQPLRGGGPHPTQWVTSLTIQPSSVMIVNMFPQTAVLTATSAQTSLGSISGLALAAVAVGAGGASSAPGAVWPDTQVPAFCACWLGPATLMGPSAISVAALQKWNSSAGAGANQPLALADAAALLTLSLASTPVVSLWVTGRSSSTVPASSPITGYQPQLVVSTTATATAPLSILCDIDEASATGPAPIMLPATLDGGVVVKVAANGSPPQGSTGLADRWLPGSTVGAITFFLPAFLHARTAPGVGLTPGTGLATNVFTAKSGDGFRSDLTNVASDTSVFLPAFMGPQTNAWFKQVLVAYATPPSVLINAPAQYLSNVCSGNGFTSCRPVHSRSQPLCIGYYDITVGDLCNSIVLDTNTAGTQNQYVELFNALAQQYCSPTGAGHSMDACACIPDPTTNTLTSTTKWSVAGTDASTSFADYVNNYKQLTGQPLPDLLTSGSTAPCWWPPCQGQSPALVSVTTTNTCATTPVVNCFTAVNDVISDPTSVVKQDTVSNVCTRAGGGGTNNTNGSGGGISDGGSSGNNAAKAKQQSALAKNKSIIIVAVVGFVVLIIAAAVFGVVWKKRKL